MCCAPGFCGLGSWDLFGQEEGAVEYFICAGCDWVDWLGTFECYNNYMNGVGIRCGGGGGVFLFGPTQFLYIRYILYTQIYVIECA